MAEADEREKLSLCCPTFWTQAEPRKHFSDKWIHNITSMTTETTFPFSGIFRWTETHLPRWLRRSSK
ncbi:unnamed protein product [Victoria cruziana]